VYDGGLKREPLRPVVADSHHFYEKQDPDLHLSDADPQPGSEHKLTQCSESGFACLRMDFGWLDADPD
jgi:hypothetical protein